VEARLIGTARTFQTTLGGVAMEATHGTLVSGAWGRRGAVVRRSSHFTYVNLLRTGNKTLNPSDADLI